METQRMMLSFIFYLFVCACAEPQSNYGIQGNDIEYTDGLPQTATLAGKVTKLNTLEPQIKLNRTSANLNCADGSMKINLSFKEPFFGIAYSDFDRNSACFASGTGNTVVTLELPLKGCGTRQDPQRVFTNNVIVRFHPGLEMEGDEVITIVCRYPPPIVEAPPIPLIQQNPIIPGAFPKPLKEFEILLIICAILFLGLMLLGLGCSYYCLRHRNIQVYRKRPFSPIDEEESEKQSTIESFQNLKIPRVHPPSESSSEVHIEETLGSDYPSSIEDAPHRPDTVSSEYSDTHVQVDRALIPPPRVGKAQFEVNMRVAKQPEAKIHYSETEGSITSVETGLAKSSQMTDLHPPPRKRAPPPVFSRIQAHKEASRNLQSAEAVDTRTVIDREDMNRETRYTQQQQLQQQPLVVKKPEVSVHTVDDVYLQTIVERRLIEDEERRTREVTQFYKKDTPKWDVVIRSHEVPEDEAWERGSETTDVASSIGWSVVDEPLARSRYSAIDRETLSRRTDLTREDTERTTTVSRAMQKLQEDDTQTWNERWQVLLRVLESPPPPPTPSHEDDDDYHSEAASVLTQDDREKWRRIITTESTLRSLLTEATVREDYERIRRDIRYEKLFEPEKWDVIIRVLAPPPTYYREDSVVSGVSSASSAGPMIYRRKKSVGESTAGESRKSMTDVRSMTEMMVDFGAALEYDDASSVLSGPAGAARSVADRSQTEIVEYAPLDTEGERHLNRNTGSNFSTQAHSVTRHLDEARGILQETRATKSTFSSSRLSRF